MGAPSGAGAAPSTGASRDDLKESVRFIRPPRGLQTIDSEVEEADLKRKKKFPYFYFFLKKKESDLRSAEIEKHSSSRPEKRIYREM